MSFFKRKAFTQIIRPMVIFVGIAVALLVGQSCSDKGNDDGGAQPEKPVNQTEIDIDPAWSPDGSKIIYLRNYASDENHSDTQWVWGVFLHDVASGSDSLLWENFEAYHFTWSPDGQSVAFSYGATIYVRALDTDSAIRVSQDGRNFGCDWSAQANRIAYHRTTPPYGTWIAAPDGSFEEKLSRSVKYPNWFSDGFRIAGVGLGSAIFIIDTDGSTYLKISPTGRVIRGVDVSPEGSAVLYARDGGGAYTNVWRTDLDSLDNAQLTTEGGNNPDWSPDGQWIVFTKVDKNNGYLWLMRPDGSEKHRITF